MTKERVVTLSTAWKRQSTSGWLGDCFSWKQRPPLCHPERSRGTCSSADLSWRTCGSFDTTEPSWLILAFLHAGHSWLDASSHAAKTVPCRFDPCSESRYR